MTYRILVDENLNPQPAAFLLDRGHEADHVEEILGKGTTDRLIREYARENESLILTNDSDFLRPSQRQGLSVLYVPENTLNAHQMASRVGALAELVPNQTDLPAVTWLSKR